MSGSTYQIANRLGTWAAIAGLAIYLLNIGQWVGAADEKFKDAESVEETQEQIKERLTRVEDNLEHLEEQSEKEHEAILDAIKRLEKKIDEDD